MSYVDCDDFRWECRNECLRIAENCKTVEDVVAKIKELMEPEKHSLERLREECHDPQR